MSKSKRQWRCQGSAVSAETPNGWTDPLAAFLNRYGELVTTLQPSIRAHDCNKALTRAGCEDYARWLKGEPKELPENPSPEDEAAALKAFIDCFQGVRSSNLTPHLQPEQAKELDELRSHAICAMRDRLRVLSGEKLPTDWSGDDWEAQEPQTRRLLHYMNGRERADLRDLCPEVWGKDLADVSDAALRTTISKANNFLGMVEAERRLKKIRNEPYLRWK
jgi:hypothetical protein